MREFAFARLCERGEHAVDEIRRAHRDHYLALAERAEPELISHGQIAWLARLNQQFDNLRAAIAYCLDDPNPEPGFRMLAATTFFWRLTGRLTEGFQTILKALNRPAPDPPTLARARALAAGVYIARTVDVGVALTYGEQAVRAARQHGDARLEVFALRWLGGALINAGRPQEAIAVLEDSLRCARAADDRHGVVSALSELAMVCEDDAETRRLLEEALALSAGVGDRYLAISVNGNLGYHALNTGDLESAVSRIRVALTAAEELEFPFHVLVAQQNLGLARLMSGDPEGAVESFAKAAEGGQAVGDPTYVAYSVQGIACSPACEGHLAAQLLGSADAALAASGQKLEPVEAQLRAQAETRLRAELGDLEFDRSHAEGQLLTVTEALRAFTESQRVPSAL